MVRSAGYGASRTMQAEQGSSRHLLRRRVAQHRAVVDAEAVEQRRERAAVGGPHDGVGGRYRVVERTDRIIRLGQGEAVADLLAGLGAAVLVVECGLQRVARPPHFMEVTAG